ncbi:MAG: ATP-binding protein [Myxococcota bacterium]
MGSCVNGEGLERQLSQAQAQVQRLEQKFAAKEREMTLATQQLRSLESQLRQAQKLEALGKLAAGVAHEINSPAQYVLANVIFVQKSLDPILRMVEAHRAFLETLPSSIDTQDLREFEQRLDLDFMLADIPDALDQSIEGMRQVSRIVLAMNDFSHPGDETRRAVDLNRAIERTVDLTRNEWKYVAQLTCELGSVPPIQGIEGDIKQVLTNLIVNAAHAVANDPNRQGKGAIRIRSVHYQDEVRIEVCDDGCGIPQTIRHRIFDPFFTTKARGKGTGQGLPLVRAVMEQHEGRVDVRTEVGEGTTFILTFPANPG